MSESSSNGVDQSQLLASGIYIQRMTPPEYLMPLIRSLRPQKTQFDLIRIGADADGGYLVPNDLDGIDVCFSPGVDVSASFEQDLFKRCNIGSHLADYSVSGPPSDVQVKSFTKKYIATVNNEFYITMDDWIKSQSHQSESSEFILQMDIEGGEYATLLSLSTENLKRFRIMIIEFHNIENWGDIAFFRTASALFEKLLSEFIVVHNHPNNNNGLVNLGGVIVPRIFELVLLRRDRGHVVGPCTEFPHPLDRPNVDHLPDIALPPNWYQF